MATQVTEKRKFVADAAFEAALDEVLNRVLAEDGYSGVEVKATTTKAAVTDIPTKEEASAFYAAYDEVLNRVLAEDGYSGVEVKAATTKAVVTEIPTKEEASPAMRGGMEGMGDMGSTKTKQ